MEGKANIQIGHVNNLEKQKVSLTYYLGPFDTVKDAQSAKYALDAVANEYGASTYDAAKIIGESETNEARTEAQENYEETVRPQ